MNPQTMTLADGRRLNWGEVGLSDGRPVVALHGTPGSRLKFAVAGDAARRLGVRLICPDRWGYAETDAPAAPGLAPYAGDMAALADHLGLERFSVLGISGGGPFAAAVAAELGSRARRLALVGPVGLIAADDPLSLPQSLSFRILRHVPGGFALPIWLFRQALGIAPEWTAALAGAAGEAADRALMRDPEVRRDLARAFHEGLRPGIRGWMIDALLFSAPWDFDPRRITCETKMWIGRDDRNVPVAAAVRLGEIIPEATVTVLDGAGHFWIARNFDVVLDWLAGRE